VYIFVKICKHDSLNYNVSRIIADIFSTPKFSCVVDAEEYGYDLAKQSACIALYYRDAKPNRPCLKCR